MNCTLNLCGNLSSSGIYVQFQPVSTRPICPKPSPASDCLGLFFSPLRDSGVVCILMNPKRSFFGFIWVKVISEAGFLIFSKFL